MTIGFIEGTLSAPGASAALVTNGVAGTLGNLSLEFAAGGNANLERSFDGVNWKVVKNYTASEDEGVRMHEAGVQWRINVISASGDIDYRLSY